MSVKQLYFKPLLSLVLFGLASCVSNKQQDPNIGIYFSTAASSLSTFKQKHNKLMDSTTTAINKMLDTYDAIVDTLNLKILLDSARQANLESIAMLNNLDEVDSSINFKSKCLDYMNEANNYYDNYFDKVIHLTIRLRQNDSLITLRRIGDEIKILSQRDKTCMKAYEDFKTKYGVQVF